MLTVICLVRAALCVDKDSWMKNFTPANVGGAALSDSADYTVAKVS